MHWVALLEPALTTASPLLHGDTIAASRGFPPPLLLAALSVFVHAFDVENYHGDIVCMVAYPFKVT